MSYTYLQGPGAESSAECFSDIEPFVRSKLNLTAEKSCCNGSETESFRGFLSGTTCELLTASPGGESSMSSAGDSRVRTSAQPGKAQASTANDPGCGAKWPESLAKYDRESRSWKTRQCLLLGGLEEFSETFPRWGSMHGGELFRQPTPVLRTCGKGSGFWPTPNTIGYRSDGELQILARAGLSDQEFRAMTHRAAESKRRRAVGNVSRSQETATTTDTVLFADLNMPKSANALGRQWTDTNTANETESCSPVQFPTPKSRDWKGATNREKGFETVANLDRGDGKPIGGSLNPTWVEWLMNWPIKWSSNDALNAENYQRWQKASTAIVQGSDGVRILWWDRDPSETPQRPRHVEQHAGEHLDALQQMPRQDACGTAVERAHETADMRELREAVHVQACQGNDMQPGVREQGGMVIAEIVPRVTQKTSNRVDRLKAIGNGQVPAVAALAWRILNKNTLEQ